MRFELKAGRGVQREVRRLADAQLVLAVRQLHALGTRRSDRAVHEARRHVRRVRALLRLLRPTLGDAYARANRRLRRAHHLLAPIADAEALVERQADVARLLGDQVPAVTLDAIRTALARHAQDVDRRASFGRVLDKAVRLVRAERLAIDQWTIGAHGVAAIAPGLQGTMRDARRAMRMALEAPTSLNYHAWRRRVKDLRLHLRLLSGRCGRQLRSEERELVALDACLGEYHDLVLLEQLLMTGADLPRDDVAACLRTLRRRKAELRGRASQLGASALHERAGTFVRHVRDLWRSSAPPATHRPRTTH